MAYNLFLRAFSGQQETRISRSVECRTVIAIHRHGRKTLSLRNKSITSNVHGSQRTTESVFRQVDSFCIKCIKLTPFMCAMIASSSILPQLVYHEARTLSSTINNPISQHQLSAVPRSLHHFKFCKGNEKVHEAATRVSRPIYYILKRFNNFVSTSHGAHQW